MPNATDTRRSRWGAEIPVALVQDFIRTGLRHEAIADFVAEYVFDALASDGQAPAELGEALRLAFNEIIEASTSADWQRVGADLVADARDALADPPATIDRARPAQQSRPPVLLAAPRAPAAGADGRWRLDEESAHERIRRDSAERFMDAFEAVTSEPDVRPTTIRIARHARLSKESLFQQFGKTAGLRFAADARRALRLPALWADIGFTEPGTPLAHIRATARAYLRLAIDDPLATRALLYPDAIVVLLAPKDARRYRTLQELVCALKARVGEQDRLLEGALAAAVVDGSLRPDGQYAAAALNAAWLQIAARAWQSPSQEAALFREVSHATDTTLDSFAPAAGRS